MNGQGNSEISPAQQAFNNALQDEELDQLIKELLGHGKAKPFAVYTVKGKVPLSALEIAEKQAREQMQDRALQIFAQYGLKFKSREILMDTLQQLLKE